MKNPFCIRKTIGTNTTLEVPGDIPLVKARTFSITVRCKPETGLTTNPELRGYYSPDGTNYDTTPYFSETINVVANKDSQETVLVSVPEHGYIRLEFENQDQSKELTNVRIWYSIQSYGPLTVDRHGDIRHDTGE